MRLPLRLHKCVSFKQKSPTLILLFNLFLASHCYRSVEPIYKHNKHIFRLQWVRLHLGGTREYAERTLESKTILDVENLNNREILRAFISVFGFGRNFLRFCGSLRSSRFFSFFRRRGDQTSERKAGERRSTPRVSKKIGEKWGGGE